MGLAKSFCPPILLAQFFYTISLPFFLVFYGWLFASLRNSSRVSVELQRTAPCPFEPPGHWTLDTGANPCSVRKANPSLARAAAAGFPLSPPRLGLDKYRTPPHQTTHHRPDYCRREKESVRRLIPRRERHSAAGPVTSRASRDA